MRATGGAQFVTAIDGAGADTAGVQVAAGGGSWSSLSDRSLKANLAAVDGRAVLEIICAAYQSAKEGRRVTLPLAPVQVPYPAALWLR